MSVLLLRSLFEHASWATARVFAAAQLLDDVSIDREIDQLGSIRSILTHMVDAHAYWLARLQECEPPALRAEAEPPTVTALRAAWDHTDAALSALLAGLTDDDLAHVVRYTNPSGAPQAYPRGQILAHQLMHAAQHRSELALALSQCGQSPGWLDVLVFVDELRERSATMPAGAAPNGG